MSDVHYVFVMYDTPVNEKDESDVSGIFGAFERIAPAVADDAVILVTAQVRSAHAINCLRLSGQASRQRRGHRL